MLFIGIGIVDHHAIPSEIEIGGTMHINQGEVPKQLRKGEKEACNTPWLLGECQKSLESLLIRSRLYYDA